MDIMDSGINRWTLQKIGSNQNKILEVGCGSGKTINKLAGKLKNISIEGIDYSEEAIAVAKRKNRIYLEQGNVNIQQGNVEKLPFEEDTFNSILAIRTHYFWPNLEISLHELYRVLKCKGHLFIFSEKQKIQYHMDTYNTNDSMEALLLRIGFHSVSFESRNNCLCISAIK